ncbi:MAG TPA: hypothetical protein P5125_05725 [Kiritimatiellia bacterium]|nr:hypothetical protein [Kiritimatiellia bacterium]HOR97012.1 hypothetical protein [Kiritimatiellia bacterium]HPC49648.1 hypothetical protein [Kiritimatiellia bacterium]HPK37197.1 hypothetical protein [Kiritimatiellia bacterium]HRU19840.1 hypothetical protein [Kiritimatiellia bacterium]
MGHDSRIRRLATAAGWVLSMFAAVGGEPYGPRRTRLAAPAGAITSRDGSIVVRAPVAMGSYRAPVLVFVDRTRDELARATRLKLVTPSCPLEIVIGNRRDGDTRVLGSRVREPGGGVFERIELPDPEAADLGRFRRAISLALLRAWMVEAGGREGVMRDVPLWLVDGVVRHTGRETRQQDIDRTLLLWSRACLPPAAALFAMESVAASREPAVAAVLASWLLERRPDGLPFEKLLCAAAEGQEWRPDAVARILTGTEDPLAFDAALDLWFTALGRTVVKPGLTSSGIVRRFRSRLLLYPAFYGTTWGYERPYLTFREAAMRSAEPEVQRRAAVQARLIEMAAVGRDGMLLAVSEAYASFLQGVCSGEAQGELLRRLMEAEGMRRELELRTARGMVLQRADAGRATGAGPRRVRE